MKLTTIIRTKLPGAELNIVLTKLTMEYVEMTGTIHMHLLSASNWDSLNLVRLKSSICFRLRTCSHKHL